MTTRLTIPEIRGQLLIVADEIERNGLTHCEKQIRALANETRRRPPVRRKPHARRSATADLRRQIREFAFGPGKDMSQEQIAAKFGVAGGRVSEAIRGRRDE